MGVAKDGMVGKKSNSVRRKSTSQINGSKDRKVDQVLLVLDGHEKDGKRKRILETLKRWKRCKKKIGAITTCKKTKQQEGILQVSGYQSCCEGGPNPDDEYVLKKALSAFMLIPRFSEIFSAAKAEKTDVHVHQEKERLEREHGKEEEALKTARIREAAEQLKKKEAELRQKEREGARFALQLMESTVDFEDNLMILKELEQLCQCSPSYVVHGSNGSAVMVLRGLKTGKVVHPLEQFGLHLKKEFMAADDDEDTYLSREIEEGEIIER